MLSILKNYPTYIVMGINKCKKLVCNLYDKKKYVVHITSLKQALNRGLKLKEIHRIIEFKTVH